MEGETARDAQVGFRPREETLNQPLAAVREEVGGGAMGRRRRGYGQKPARQRHGIKSRRRRTGRRAEVKILRSWRWAGGASINSERLRARVGDGKIVR